MDYETLFFNINSIHLRHIAFHHPLFAVSHLPRLFYGTWNERRLGGEGGGRDQWKPVYEAKTSDTTESAAIGSQLNRSLIANKQDHYRQR
jgi:hypothetical protein